MGRRPPWSCSTSYDRRLARHHLLGAVRRDVLSRLGRHNEAAAELEPAAALAPTRHERILLMERSAAAAAIADYPSSIRYPGQVLTISVRPRTPHFVQGFEDIVAVPRG